MKLLVTGLSGFVGTWLRRSLCDPGESSRYKLVSDGGVDLLAREQLAVVLAAASPDAVIHLAARSNVADSLADPYPTVEVNVMGTLNLLDAMERAGFFGRFLFVGSGDQYGLVSPEQLPLQENSPLMPRNPYAASKCAAECLVLERARRGRLDAVCARSFNHTGPDQDARFVLPSLARQIVRISRGRQPPEIVVGDLDVTRDFLDVRDVVRAYFRLLAAGESGATYNVCSGVERHLGETAETLMRVAGVTADIVRSQGMLRPAEQRRSCGDGQRLRALGWQPLVPWEATLQDLIAHWHERIDKETT